jgi:hypothetical protein
MNVSRRGFITLCGITAAAIAIVPEPGWSRRATVKRAQPEFSRRHIMVEQMTKSTFEPYLNTAFRIQATPDQIVDVTLIDVSEKHSDAKLEQFSLLFQGPRETLLPQKIYSFDHTEMGNFELFIVPVIHLDQTKFYYQAAFSRISK